MNTLRFDLARNDSSFMILNATNEGPWHKRHTNDQYRSNFADYKAARIPYSRNHDSGVVGIYGGPYSHDITYVFPNFDADPYDPASYDFPCTDESILVCLEAGTETFFRLGQTIEHQIKKHGTIPPKDFHKWAVICGHIIRHYNEGWADGFHLNIQYWEIWNEPDLDTDDSANKRTRGGTKAQFFDLYGIAYFHNVAAVVNRNLAEKIVIQFLWIARAHFFVQFRLCVEDLFLSLDDRHVLCLLLQMLDDQQRSVFYRNGCFCLSMLIADA